MWCKRRWVILKRSAVVPLSSGQSFRETLEAPKQKTRERTPNMLYVNCRDVETLKTNVTTIFFFFASRKRPNLLRKKFKKSIQFNFFQTFEIVHGDHYLENLIPLTQLLRSLHYITQAYLLTRLSGIGHGYNIWPQIVHLKNWVKKHLSMVLIFLLLNFLYYW